MQFGGQHGGVPTFGMAYPGYVQSEDGVRNPEMTWYAYSFPFSINFVDASFRKSWFFVILCTVPLNHLSTQSTYWKKTCQGGI